MFGFPNGLVGGRCVGFDAVTSGCYLPFQCYRDEERGGVLSVVVLCVSWAVGAPGDRRSHHPLVAALAVARSRAGRTVGS